MKLWWKDVLTSLFMGMVLPGLLLNGAALLPRPQEVSAIQETVPQSQPDPVWIPVLGADGIQQQELEVYLVGVVLGEMPAWFEPEALKAQSVVARTYALKAFCAGGKHGNGSICTSAGCCQAYVSEADYLENGGTWEQLQRVRSAVAATAGAVVTWEGELIEATYFSCSGGQTEDAAAVWGTDYPYLRSVSSPGEEAASYYTDQKSFEPEVFCAALDIAPSGPPESWLGPATYTAGGGVASMSIGGTEFTGTQLRSLLGLRSTALAISVEDDAVTVTTKGYGHRVGMSQYGADAMAVAGSSWQEILAHYYPGTTVRQLAEIR